MNPPLMAQSLQILAWFLALLEVVAGLYMLATDAWHRANRHLTALLVLLSLNTLALGSLSSAAQASQAYVPTLLLAATTPAIPSLLLITALVVLPPAELTPVWLRGRAWWALAPFYALVVLPAILTVADASGGTHFWYTGLPVEAYQGGFVPLAAYTGGILARIVRLGCQALPAALLFLSAGYLGLSARRAPVTRRLAWLLLATQVVILLLSSGLLLSLPALLLDFLENTLFALVFAYAGLRQMAAERRPPRGWLQLRLPASMLAVALPVLVGLAFFLTSRAGALLESEAADKMRTNGNFLAQNVTLWLDTNIHELEVLVQQADIQSMDPALQRPLLEVVKNTYPHLYTLGTFDMQGISVASSGTTRQPEASGRDWFQNARQGVPVTFQTEIDPASGQPALVVSAPIRDARGVIVGVGMFASHLDVIASQVLAVRPSRNGVAYIVNEFNQVIAHTDPAVTSGLRDLSDYPPVGALRGLARGGPAAERMANGLLSFSDDQGVRWLSYGAPIGHGWAAFIQLSETEFYQSARVFRRLSVASISVGALLLFGLSWLIVRRAVRPVATLTRTTAAIAAGDLSQVAPVETDDELGLLARAFNSMTGQLRELITNLERRVTERTKDLEKRARQLQAASEVAQEAATIRDLEGLLEHTVGIISDRFDYYHTGIFLLDQAGQYAILRAASSAGGARMLARGHRLEVGKVGIVGHAAASGQARIALDVGVDAVYFNNPDLPETRSELALPLVANQQVIGVLDVQSTRPAAFGAEDVTVLQILANQLALAIDNARLFAQTQATLHELQTRYAQQVGQAWQARLAAGPLEYQYDPRSEQTAALEDPDAPAALPATIDGQAGHKLAVPVLLRGQKLGVLNLLRTSDQPPWDAEEVQLVYEIMGQIALAIENARLLEETQARARREQITSHVTTRMRETLDMETVLRTAADELRKALNLQSVTITLDLP